MFKGVFITGTDTGVGKTLVAAKCYRDALRRGVETVAVKPVQTGCKRLASGEWTGVDTDIYRAAAEGLPGGRVVVCRHYEPACSPHLASRLCGERLTVASLAADVAAASDGRPLVVEGAGGLLVPLNEQETMLDLILALALPTLVVADNKLGAINHTLLTVQTLARAGATVAGFVLNQCSPGDPESDFIRLDNREIIATMADTPCLFSLPHIADFPPDDARFWHRLEAADG